MVDKVVIYDDNEMLLNLIKGEKPDFLVVGENWRDKVIGSEVSEVVYVDLYDISTTKIENRILRNIK
jgi:bifunctional ADP-heptose synthase (sugar kinase/adenylyltransferase)